MTYADSSDLEPKTGTIRKYDPETRRGMITCGTFGVGFHLTTYKGTRPPIIGELVTVYFDREKCAAAIFPRPSY